MVHCLAAVPGSVSQFSLVLFSHILDFKNATGPNLNTELSFYIPVLNTAMCPPVVIITHDTVRSLLGGDYL